MPVHIGAEFSLELIDLQAFQRQLNAEHRAAMREEGRRMVKSIKGMWRGWKYENAPRNQRGRSRRGWKALTGRSKVPVLTIVNNAESYRGGKPYVAFVKRSKGSPPEVEAVEAMLMREHLEPLRQLMAKHTLIAIEKAKTTIKSGAPAPAPAAPRVTTTVEV